MVLPARGSVIPQCLTEQLPYRALGPTVTIYHHRRREDPGGFMEV